MCHESGRIEGRPTSPRASPSKQVVIHHVARSNNRVWHPVRLYETIFDHPHSTAHYASTLGDLRRLAGSFGRIPFVIIVQEGDDLCGCRCGPQITRSCRAATVGEQQLVRLLTQYGRSNRPRSIYDNDHFDVGFVVLLTCALHCPHYLGTASCWYNRGHCGGVPRLGTTQTGSLLRVYAMSTQSITARIASDANVAIAAPASC